MTHPCLTCGACCATFRVSFHWSEADPELAEPDFGGPVPVEMTEPFGPHLLAMRGTWAVQPRCVALDAEIGLRSRCRIHPQRPSPCRDVAASWESGTPSLQCDKARQRHGLPVLTSADWPAYRRTADERTGDGDEDLGEEGDRHAVDGPAALSR